VNEGGQSGRLGRTILRQRHRNLCPAIRRRGNARKQPHLRLL
jgi:hypothetical protein